MKSTSNLSNGRAVIPAAMRAQLNIMEGARLQTENKQLKAEVQDLKTGMDMVEEKARSELGMLKPNEILIQYTK